MKIPDVRWPAEPRNYDDDLLLEVRAGTVVLLIRGRNAWHSTWVRHYLRNATLYTDVSSAKLGAERQRGPGNVFYIVEAPALLLSGQSSNIVLCDAHPDNPFGAFRGFSHTATESLYGAWVDGLFPGVSVRDAVAAFRHDSGLWSGPTPSEHSLRTGMLNPTDLFDTKPHRMQSFVSRPVGSHYYLQWDLNASGNRYNRRGSNAVARRWNENVAEIVKGRKRADTRARYLRRHREEVLKALPKSQWLDQQSRAAAEKRAAHEAVAILWSAASDRVTQLEEAVREAEVELKEAREARMAPARTSDGIRKQRERVEAAETEIGRRSAALALAEDEAAELWRKYRQSLFDN